MRVAAAVAAVLAVCVVAAEAVGGRVRGLKLRIDCFPIADALKLPPRMTSLLGMRMI